MDDWLNIPRLEMGPVILEPLKQNHREGLLAAASDGKLWGVWHASVPDEHTIDQYLTKALSDQDAGKAHCFAVIHKYSNEIIGSTRFYDCDVKNRRLDIGYTWYAKRYQKTGVNTRCKYLLLSYAFEHFSCIAVGFLTNSFNRTSRNAIERLGAKQDGIIRNHRIDENGLIRDSVMYSITREEWPAVKRNLEFYMERGGNAK